ncbi:hypothetical protein [Stenotrophomonas virus Jojan60]|nr:hypothetical protein [Stenotrophomonas virus Jojan60]
MHYSPINRHKETTMDTYEYPLGVTFKASSPEHAAARLFGGKPADYLVTIRRNNATSIIPGPDFRWAEVTSADGDTFYGDIPIID